MSLRSAVRDAGVVAVAGSGVLGVEAAYQLRLMDKDVVLFGSGPRPMTRMLDDETAASLADGLRDGGVDYRPDIRLEKVRRDGRRMILDTDADEIRADYAVFCLGIMPDIDAAREAGLECGRGIRVDASLRTSASDVYAAGDAAEHPDGVCTGLWHAAEHQGKLAADAILGRPAIHDHPPYRCKCEVFGGYWFSAGPVTSGGHGAAESWEIDGVLWRPRFADGRLISLAGAAIGGLSKERAKQAQSAVLRGADPIAVRRLLSGDAGSGVE